MRFAFLSAAVAALNLAAFAALGHVQIQAAELKKPIATILEVGPQGKGAAAAARAFQELVKSDATDLPQLLAALDGANPLAANWLRSAVDAVAERQLKGGGHLPNAELEAFVRETSHDPRARRLAFEWLAKADASAPDRMIPGMLNDPSVEFRRDAVARLLAQAEGLAKAEKKDDAKAVYEQALVGARDLDQVQEIVKALEPLGRKVDVPAHFGFVTKWKVIGPFDNSGEKGFDAVFPPEETIDFAAELPGKSGAVKWIDASTDDPYGTFDLNKTLGKANGVVAYLAADFVVDKARPVDLRLGSTNANKLWLNGKLLFANKFYHQNEQLDQYVARGELKPGKNRILLKILQNEMKEPWAQEWHFQFRVCDEVGTAVLSADRQAAGDANAG